MSLTEDPRPIKQSAKGLGPESQAGASHSHQHCHCIQATKFYAEMRQQASSLEKYRWALSLKNPCMDSILLFIKSPFYPLLWHHLWIQLWTVAASSLCKKSRNQTAMPQIKDAQVLGSGMMKLNLWHVLLYFFSRKINLWLMVLVKKTPN